MVKGKKNGNTKAPSPSPPCKRNWMLCSLNHRQDITVRENTKLKASLLPFKELNMGNGDLSTNSECDNCSNINSPLHHSLNQVDSNTNLLDEVILTVYVFFNLWYLVEIEAYS